MTHQPKGSMCISCGNANASCASRPFASMPVIKTYPDGVKAVKCTGHVHAQASTEKNEALQQVLVAALEEARSAINSMKVEAETAGQGDEQMMLEACETISNEGLQADMAIRAALASAPKPSSTPQADSQPALPKITAEDRSFLHYNPNTDDIVEWVCRYASAAITADRAARAPADSVTAPASGATSKNLLQVQAWVIPDGNGGGQFSWQKQDERYWTRLTPPAQAAPQPAVQQGAPVAWRSWDSENSRWNFTLWPDEWAGHADVWEPLYTYTAAPVAQGDAQQRAMDARHAAIYRWIIQHIDKAASIIDAWREDGEADKDELHDALAARAAKEGAKYG